jgi:hypothetical protein
MRQNSHHANRTLTATPPHQKRPLPKKESGPIPTLKRIPLNPILPYPILQILPAHTKGFRRFSDI